MARYGPYQIMGSNDHCRMTCGSQCAAGTVCNALGTDCVAKPPVPSFRFKRDQPWEQRQKDYFKNYIQGVTTDGAAFYYAKTEEGANPKYCQLAKVKLKGGAVTAIHKQFKELSRCIHLKPACVMCGWRMTVGTFMLYM